MELVRNALGYWCVAVPAGEYEYETVHGRRELRRLPVPRCANREEAEAAARAMCGGPSLRDECDRADVRARR